MNLHEIIRQQQEQLAAMQAQIQALLAAGGAEREGRGLTWDLTWRWPNQPSSMEKQEKWEDL